MIPAPDWLLTGRTSRDGALAALVAEVLVVLGKALSRGVRNVPFQTDLGNVEPGRFFFGEGIVEQGSTSRSRPRGYHSLLDTVNRRPGGGLQER